MLRHIIIKKIGYKDYKVFFGKNSYKKVKHILIDYNYPEKFETFEEAGKWLIKLFAAYINYVRKNDYKL